MDANRETVFALPLNRKEGFYTGAVLPPSVCRDDFAHFAVSPR